MNDGGNKDGGNVEDVWASNQEEAFTQIRELIVNFPYLGMDTEFPGIVAKPIGQFASQSAYHYEVLKTNVDLLKIIQLGITFFDAEGNCPHPVATWQFNFKFNTNEDMYNQDSIQLLNRAGLQFDRHATEGIDVNDFAELFMTSGLILSPDVHWITFHSGYDFGYLLRLLTCVDIPTNEQDFFELLRIYFPVLYDIKYLMKSCKTLKGGLQEVADEVGVVRIGAQHQAGSDSLLTGQTFFKMRSMFFEGIIDNERFNCMLYGLGTSY